MKNRRQKGFVIFIMGLSLIAGGENYKNSSAAPKQCEASCPIQCYDGQNRYLGDTPRLAACWVRNKTDCQATYGFYCCDFCDASYREGGDGLVRACQVYGYGAATNAAIKACTTNPYARPDAVITINY